MQKSLGTLTRNLRKDTFFLILFAGLVLLSGFAPGRIASYGSLVDWPTIAALTGLLLLTKGLEVSGGLHWLGQQLISRMATQRTAALFLVAAAALLSTMLTNDVALFVVVPLTLGVCRVTKIPATKLIVFEALAVNAGSALTPIGNPQNLFLWQLSKVSFGEFMWQMLPLVALLMGGLLILTALTFKSLPMHASVATCSSSFDRLLLGVSVCLYLPFLIATEMHHGSMAVVMVLALFLMLRPRVLLQLDWALLLVFVLMFIDLRLVAGLDLVRKTIYGLELSNLRHLYFAGIGLSQVISNVPAAIALAEFSKDWRVIAYGVNVGGFGLMVGSLANLIALRLCEDRKAWICFHAYAVPTLFGAAAVGYAILFASHT